MARLSAPTARRRWLPASPPASSGTAAACTATRSSSSRPDRPIRRGNRSRNAGRRAQRPRVPALPPRRGEHARRRLSGAAAWAVTSARPGCAPTRCERRLGRRSPVTPTPPRSCEGGRVLALKQVDRLIAYAYDVHAPHAGTTIRHGPLRLRRGAALLRRRRRRAGQASTLDDLGILKIEEGVRLRRPAFSEALAVAGDMSDAACCPTSSRGRPRRRPRGDQRAGGGGLRRSRSPAPAARSSGARTVPRSWALAVTGGTGREEWG